MNLRIGIQPHLLAIRVDIPQPLNPSRQFFFFRFGKGDILFAEGGEGTGEIGVFDVVVVFCFFGVVDCCWASSESCWDAGVGY